MGIIISYIFFSLAAVWPPVCLIPSRLPLSLFHPLFSAHHLICVSVCVCVFARLLCCPSKWSLSIHLWISYEEGEWNNNKLHFAFSVDSWHTGCSLRETNICLSHYIGRTLHAYKISLPSLRFKMRTWFNVRVRVRILAVIVGLSHQEINVNHCVVSVNTRLNLSLASLWVSLWIQI